MEHPQKQIILNGISMLLLLQKMNYPAAEQRGIAKEYIFNSPQSGGELTP